METGRGDFKRQCQEQGVRFKESDRLPVGKFPLIDRACVRGDSSQEKIAKILSLVNESFLHGEALKSQVQKG